MRLCLPPDDCMLTHFHIFQGNGSPECARRRQKRQQKQSNCLASVNQFSMAFATPSTDSVYNERKHLGKAGKEKQKTAPKSIQGYFAMYPRINRQVSSITLPSILASFFCLPCHIRRGKPAEQIAPSSFVMQRNEIIQDSKCAPLHHPARHGYTRSRQGAKSRRGCPENETASC